MAAIPAAPKENAGTGDKVLFMTYDAAGTLYAALFHGYHKETLDAQSVSDLGVYAKSGLMAHGQRDLTDDTFALQLHPASAPCQSVLVHARLTNTAGVWVGGSAMSADTNETTGGYKLEPGQSVMVPCRNLDEVFIMTDNYVVGDGVEWLAGVDA